jgi:hypothetical protein
MICHLSKGDGQIYFVIISISSVYRVSKILSLTSTLHAVRFAQFAGIYIRNSKIRDRLKNVGRGAKLCFSLLLFLSLIPTIKWVLMLREYGVFSGHLFSVRKGVFHPNFLCKRLLSTCTCKFQFRRPTCITHFSCLLNYHRRHQNVLTPVSK